MIGITSSAGAQIDFTLISVRDRTFTISKTDYTAFGHGPQQSGSSLSKTSLEFLDGSSENCTLIESTTQSSLNTDFADVPAASSNAFRTLVLTGSNGTINKHLVSAASYNPGDSKQIIWAGLTSSEVLALSESNDDICIMEFRAD
tara:strand:- start:28 stop:462 length:435 start_codon:yes stop_codon:yes gene_type:complete